MQKRFFLFLFFLSALACDRTPAPRAPQTTSSSANTRKIIGVATFVDHIVLNTIRDSFLHEIQSLGYSKENGWDTVVKSANGQPLEAVSVAQDLINLRPVVLVSISTPATKPLFDKNRGQIPQVYSFVSFPRAIGISDQSPNITGLSDGVDFAGCVKLIRAFVPKIATMGMVYSDEPNAVVSRERMQAICKENRIGFRGQSVVSEAEVKCAVQSILSSGVDAIFVGADGVIVNQIQAVVEAATRSKVPVFSADEGSVKLGAVAALSVNYAQFGQATARLVDKVIKAGEANAKDASEYIGKDIVVNIQAANSIGLRIPSDVQKRAVKEFP